MMGYMQCCIYLNCALSGLIELTFKHAGLHPALLD